MSSMLRVMAIVAVLLGLLTGRATACLGTAFTSSIFYSHEEMPTAPQVEAIAEVTILEEGATDSGEEFGIARVDQVIKGSVGDTIRIITVVSSCQSRFAVGDHGIVMGNWRKNQKGELELLTQTETRAVKRGRQFERTK